MKLEKIISIIRTLNEDVPTVSTGEGISTYDKPMNIGKKRKKTPKGHVGSRVPWLQYLRNK